MKRDQLDLDLLGVDGTTGEYKNRHGNLINNPSEVGGWSALSTTTPPEDANKDGKVALQEMTSKPNPAFEILDKNKDCQIGSDEVVQTRQVQQLKSNSGDTPTDMPGSGPGGPGRH